LPPVPDSPLARWDERWKIAGLGAMAVAGSVTESWPVAAGQCGVAFVALTLGRIRPSTVFATTGLLLTGLLPLAVAIPLLSPRGWEPGLTLALRGLSVGWILVALIGSTVPHRLFAALGRLGVPSLLVNLTQFALRYSWLLAAEAKRVRVAMAARGGRFGPPMATAKLTGQLAGRTIARSQQRAETIARAMAARGFDGTWHPLAPFRTTWPDAAATIACLTISGLWLVARFDFGG
jgi:cobalt/nickel transport system permease protein